MSADIIQFPDKPDPYVRYKADKKEMDKFNETLDIVMGVWHAAYPGLEFEDRDYVLAAESSLAMIMAAEGIEHPLNAFADTIGKEFLEEYV